MPAPKGFHDRSDAGRRLAEELRGYAGRDDLLVLALPRGGVPVAVEVASQLAAPLDVLVVRKLGVPSQPELAMGAIASGGVRILREDVITRMNITEDAVARVAAEEQEELERRERAYRGDRPEADLSGRTVVIVDDGLATGSTMSAAVAAVRASDPREIVVAVPVGPRETCDAFRGSVDAVFCFLTPEPFQSVGAWYAQFPQTSDEEVRSLLERAAEAG